MIAQASICDLPELATLGPLFWEEGKLPGKFIPWKFIGTWKRFIASGDGAIFCLWNESKIVGAIGAMVAPDINDGERVAHECFWFVKEAFRAQGLKLLLAYEKWAKLKKAARIVMVHLCSLQPERLHKLYERMGYYPVEVHFYKTLQ